MGHLPVLSMVLLVCLLPAACDSDDSGDTGASDTTTSQPGADTAPADVIADITLDTALPDTAVAETIEDAGPDTQVEVDSQPADTQPADTQPADTAPQLDTHADTAVDTTDAQTSSCTTIVELNQFETLDVTADTAPPAVYALALSPQTAVTVDTFEFYTALNGQPADDEEPTIAVGLYTHVNGQGPGALLASGAVTVTETPSWWRISMDSPVALAGDQRYWVVFEPLASMILPWATVGSDDVTYVWGFAIGEWWEVGTNLQKPWMMKALDCQ